MLEDDVASNKAIGSYGADSLYRHADGSKKLSVLTHCNTGRYISKHALILLHTFLLRGSRRTWILSNCLLIIMQFVLSVLQQPDLVLLLV